MLKIKRRSVGSRLEAPRLTAALLMTTSVAYLLFDDAEFRLNSMWVYALLAAYILSMYAITRYIRVIAKQTEAYIINTVLCWSVLCALFIPLTPQLLLVSIFLAAGAARYVQSSHAIIAVLIMCIATEAGYILGDTHSYDNFWKLLVQVLSVILICLATAWYRSSKRTVHSIEHAESEKSNIERERLQALINSMTDGVVATDTNGIVEVYNGSVLDIINVNANLAGNRLIDFMNVTDKDGNAVDFMVLAAQQQGYLVSRDYILHIGSAEEINLYISISPVKIGFGKASEEGFIVLLRDITREKSLEEERDEFISVVSHELRTPITIAEGNISNALLVAGKVDMPQAVTDSLDAAHKQVVFLADMINDLATLSRAERGKLQAAPENIDVHDLVKSLQRDYRNSAQQKNIEFMTHVDKEVDSVFSSRLYVREILQNFLTNAIKYTIEGTVSLNVTMQGNRVAFAITDSGIGISKTDQKHLFKKFFRSEDYRTRQNNGTGLGLYVTLKLAKLINAQIKVDSELNKGSTFTVLIPSMKRKNIPEVE